MHKAWNPGYARSARIREIAVVVLLHALSLLAEVCRIVVYLGLILLCSRGCEKSCGASADKPESIITFINVITIITITSITMITIVTTTITSSISNILLSLSLRADGDRTPRTERARARGCGCLLHPLA